MITFGPIGRLIFISGALSTTWICWSVLPQQAVETVRMPKSISPPHESLEFGPRVFDLPKLGCSLFASIAIVLPDRTWTADRNSDESLRIWERGTNRELCTLPPGKREWIVGSKMCRRIGFDVDDEYQVWDVAKRTILFRARSKNGRIRLTDSGRHVRLFDSKSGCLMVVSLEQPDQGVSIPCIQKSGHDLGSNEQADLLQFLWECFSPDGRWLMLGVVDQFAQEYLWLWDLQLGKPVWRQQSRSLSGVNNLRRPAQRDFDSSSSYFSAKSEADEILLDISTSPPTDISALIGVPGTWRVLGDRRYLALSDEENPKECRIWDLDQRKILGCHCCTRFRYVSDLTPNDEFAILSIASEDTRILRYLADGLAWLGIIFPWHSHSYLVIDMKNGGIVNRFAGGNLDQFDPELQHIWTETGLNDPGAATVEYQRFPLRSAGAPWWLWMITIAGAALCAASFWKWWVRRSQPAVGLAG